MVSEDVNYFLDTAEVEVHCGVLAKTFNVVTRNLSVY